MLSPTLTLEDIVSKTPDLPTLSAAAIAVVRESDSANGSAQSVAKALTQDQALTARVLRLANSAYYGLSRSVLDAQEAVIILGLRCIKNLAMVAATYPMLDKPLAGYCIEPSQLWAHSFGTAVGAQLAANRSRKVSGDVAFTAGLLHNIGKLAVSVWLENKIGGLNSIAEKAGMSFDAIERKLLGYDHAEVGAHLAERWNLPDQLIAAIKYHHRPSEAPQPNFLVDCVHIGDYLTMTMGIGMSGEGLRYEFDDTVLARLGLTPEDLDEMTVDFLESYNQHERLFEEEIKA